MNYNDNNIDENDRPVSDWDNFIFIERNNENIRNCEIEKKIPISTF